MSRTFVEKSWGSEDWISNSSLYCGKDLFIKKGKWISLHYHKLKTETFYVQGRVQLVVYENPELDVKFISWKFFDEIVKERTPRLLAPIFPQKPFDFDWSGYNQSKIEFGPAPRLPCQEDQIYKDVKVIELNHSDSFDIPVGMRHALFAHVDSHVFEFSTQHFDEDSYRILNSSERN